VLRDRSLRLISADIRNQACNSRRKYS